MTKVIIDQQHAKNNVCLRGKSRHKLEFSIFRAFSFIPATNRKDGLGGRKLIYFYNINFLNPNLSNTRLLLPANYL